MNSVLRINQHPIRPRELEVWKLIARGVPTKEIEVLLGATKNTVLSWRRNLYRKIRVNCSAQAALAAVRHGVIHVEVIEFYGNTTVHTARQSRAC